MTTPPPGSETAVVLGCNCPRMDNAYGKGFMGMEGVYVYREGCPVHANDVEPDDKIPVEFP